MRCLNPTVDLISHACHHYSPCSIELVPEIKVRTKAVAFTGACANEIIPSINRSFVCKAKEGRDVRITIIVTEQPCSNEHEGLSNITPRPKLTYIYIYIYISNAVYKQLRHEMLKSHCRPYIPRLPPLFPLFD
jgi:hypothetical protein